MVKPKKCAICSKEFKPYKSTQRVCSTSCAVKWAETKREKAEAKAWRQKKKALKDGLKNKQDYEKDLERVFNEYIRLRDYNKPCISCRAPAHTFKKSAGHYFPAGSYKNLRFNEDNVHLQCWYNCNKQRHGNLAAYLPHLINKIGEDRYKDLLRLSNIPAHYTIPELQEMIKTYKDKVKELKKRLDL